MSFGGVLVRHCLFDNPAFYIVGSNLSSSLNWKIGDCFAMPGGSEVSNMSWLYALHLSVMIGLVQCIKTDPDVKGQILHITKHA